MPKELLVIGEILGSDTDLTLAQLCRVCQVPADLIMDLVAEGILEPRGRETVQWRFSGASVRRVRCAIQLHRDLGINWAGAALALELLEEIHVLRARIENTGP